MIATSFDGDEIPGWLAIRVHSPGVFVGRDYSGQPVSLLLPRVVAAACCCCQHSALSGLEDSWFVVQVCMICAAASAAPACLCC